MQLLDGDCTIFLLVFNVICTEQSEAVRWRSELYTNLCLWPGEFQRPMTSEVLIISLTDMSLITVHGSDYAMVRRCMAPWCCGVALQS